MIYLSLMSTEVSERILIYTDGAAEPNPGHAGIGVVVFNEQGVEICRHHEYVGERTNNQAEYLAILKGLDIAAGICRREVICHSDSELVVRQINGLYRIKNSELRELCTQVLQKRALFKRVDFVHVPREQPRMRIADQLSRQAIRERGA